MSRSDAQPHASSSAIRDRMLVTLIGLLLFLTNLGATRLWDVDEAIFTRCAVEMHERNDWVTPYYNGQMFGHKPPLMYWCQILAFELFGTTEFAARFFSAVCGIGTMLLTFEIGRTLFNRRAGFWGAIALGSSINFAVIARAATPDAYLTFFCTLAMWVLVRGAQVRSSTATAASAESWQPQLPLTANTYALFYAAIAGATLVKGPIVGGIVPIAVWGMFLLIAQTWQEGTPSQSSNRWLRAISIFRPDYFLKTVWRMRPIMAVVLILLIAGPWYAWVGLRTNGEFLREFFLVHNFGRAATAMESHSGPIFYYLIAVCIGTFPWCVLLGPALGNAIRAIRQQTPSRAAYTFLACWSGVWIGILSLAGTKLPSYVIPCYPALALGFASLIDQWLTVADPERCRRWLRAAWSTTAVVGVGILVAVPIVTRIFLGGEWTPALIGLVPLAGALVGLWYSEHQKLAQSLATLPVVGVLFCVSMLGFAVLPIDAHQNSQSMTDFARSHATAEPILATHNFLPPSLVYYHGKPIEGLGSPQHVGKFFTQHPTDAFLITTDKQQARLAATLPPDVVVLKRERRFLRNGEIVLLGRKPSLAAASSVNASERR